MEKQFSIYTKKKKEGERKQNLQRKGKNMANGKNRWEGDRRKTGRGSDAEQCGETGSRKRAGKNLAMLGWAGMAGQPVFVV